MFSLRNALTILAGLAAINAAPVVEKRNAMPPAGIDDTVILQYARESLIQSEPASEPVRLSAYGSSSSDQSRSSTSSSPFTHKRSRSLMLALSPPPVSLNGSATGTPFCHPKLVSALTKVSGLCRSAMTRDRTWLFSPVRSARTPLKLAPMISRTQTLRVLSLVRPTVASATLRHADRIMSIVAGIIENVGVSAYVSLPKRLSMPMCRADGGQPIAWCGG